MTIDRAIEILDPEHRENYDGMDEAIWLKSLGMLLSFDPYGYTPQDTQKKE